MEDEKEITQKPDPTVVTTQQIDRATRSLRELIEARLGTFDERFTCSDRDMERMHIEIQRREHDIDTKVNHLKGLTDEKFSGAATQFKERDTRSERESRDNKVAVDAAFAAQKEAAAKQDESNQKAIDKSEIATAEKINKLAELFKTTTDALRSNHDDLKERFTKFDGRRVGGVERGETVRDNTSLFVSIGALTIGLLGMLAAGYANLKPREPSIQPTLQLAPQPPTAHP